MSSFKARHMLTYIFFIAPVLTKLNFPNIRLRYWMQDLPEQVKELPLMQVAIPGSHDSMTYGINYWSDLAPDAPDAANNFIVKLFHTVAKGSSVTQTVNVTRQLEIGIRYFDLRVATRETQPDKFFFTHAFYADEVFEQLKLMKAFLNSHSKEVVILDFQHLYGFNRNNHIRFVKELIDIFQPLIYKIRSGVKDITLSCLHKDQKQVIIIYRHHDTWLHDPDLFWKDYHISSPWPETDDTTSLIRILRQNIKDRRNSLLNAFVVTQGVITASTRLITQHLFQSLHGCCDQKVMNVLIPFIELERPGPSPDGTINIVIADFVDTQDARFPKTVIATNYKLKKTNKIKTRCPTTI